VCAVLNGSNKKVVLQAMTATFVCLNHRFDERVRDLLDFSIYLDISDEVKFAWKIQVRKYLYVP
jgi:pantothenate kinase